MNLTLNFLPSTYSLLQKHEQAGQQPDNLCGPYWVSLLLESYAQLSLSAVEVARAASTILPSQGNPSDWIPPGAISRTGEGYSTIPTVPNIDECGTAVEGLIQATEQLSQGHFCLLPLQTEDWEAGLETLVQICHDYPDWEMVPLLNIHTSYFWGSQLTLSAMAQFLQHGERPVTSPDWRVGHFALLAGQIQGSAQGIGSAQGMERRLYAILDTYPQFGWNGLHLQPLDAIAQSLHRPQQSTQGGILLFTPSKSIPQLQNKLVQTGFRISSWDNGTPFCPS
ncbi:MAG: hypothetical protein AAGL08_03035 [Cyanobacteria bacterium J06573_11]